MIFEDTLKAIQTVLSQPFGVESIVAINSQFVGDSFEQPYHPGKLRDAVVDPIRDRIHVDLWPGADGKAVAYYPPAQIDERDLETIIEHWHQSKQTDEAAWTLFAELAKLQPFQDGNKRTALIAANHALGALENQNYLMPPTGRAYNQFMDHLLGYYGVGLEGGPASEHEALNAFVSLAPRRKALTLDEEIKKAQAKHEQLKSKGEAPMSQLDFDAPEL
ncbi:Fic family protein [Lactococcus garvieae]|uniref:Fic family protein n=1 Tax=Lactococcus garvieae TaxID=1363 RepID=UPI0015A5AE61|nr:Fic family protein [Lactococcus garvieae]